MNDQMYMKRCLDLAQRGKGLAEPNPMVGAVLVHNGRVIGQGWHHRYGHDHAEVDCLNNVAAADLHLVSESNMYVTLEPCAHFGKTPPCAHRLVKEGIRKVVIANVDPFEQVNGRGIQILKDAGIEVVTGILEDEGRWVNRRFFAFHRLQRPYVVLKWAQTADGYIAPADGRRLQISNGHSQLLVHKWRTEEAAIMVGTNTALSDDPRLTARLWKGRQPLRIVLDRELRVPAAAQVYNSDAATWVVNESQEGEAGNVTYVRLSFNDGLLPALWTKMYRQGILSVIVEGGAQLLHSIISAGLWDEARIFTGCTTLGGGIPAPLLTHSAPAFSSLLEQDRLQVFINSATGIAYPMNMEL